MPKTIDTLVEDVYSLFKPDVHHEANEGNLRTFADNVCNLIRERLSNQDRGGALRFSSLGKKDRQIWYAANEPEKAEEMSPKTYLKFLYGDVIEQLMVLLIKESGHAVTDEQLEIELNGVVGHIDCKIDGIVSDVKSASPYSFKKFKNGSLFNDDPFGYIGQISGYSNVLTPGEGPAFVAFDKVHGDICVLSVPSSVTATYSPSERIAHLKKVITKPEKPERCYPEENDGKSGNKKLGTNCSYCAFKYDCYKDANGGKGIRTFLYSNGPRFLTEVVRTPDVREVGVEVDSEDEHIVPF